MKNAKRMTAKAVTMLIAILMVASVLPITVFASEPADTTEYVYLSISYDQFYINDKNGSPMVYVPVALSEIAAVDLLSATAYSNGEAVATVSITGNGNCILNLPINGTATDCVITLDEEKNSDTTTSRPNSDGSSTEQDKYQTDPVPEGKPLPIEPENQEINKGKSYTCIFSIECSTILNNLADLDPDKLELIPADGVILPPTEVTFYEGESVFDVIQRVCKEKGIHLEFSWTPIYNSAYIEGIHNLYEFDCGALSGWTYRVNGWYPNYGCSRYQLADGEVVEWRYTCDLGKDVGCDLMS